MPLLHTHFSAGNARAVSVQLAFFTTRKQWLGFLAELRVNQTPDVAVCFAMGGQRLFNKFDLI